MVKFRTHYDNLKVARNAPDAVIRAAYKTLMQQYHPDKYDGHTNEALRIVKIIKNSYEILIDPVKREQHNQWIEAQSQKKNEQKTTYSDSSHFHFNSRENDLRKQKILTETELYEMVAEELDAGKTKKGVMARAFVESEGDMQRSTARYIKMRVESLKEEQIKLQKSKKKQEEMEEFYILELKKMGFRVSPISTTTGITEKWMVVTQRGEKYELYQLKDFKELYQLHKNNSQRLLANIPFKTHEYLIMIVVVLVSVGINVLFY